jgi:hypothetical protein
MILDDNVATGGVKTEDVAQVGTDDDDDADGNVCTVHTVADLQNALKSEEDIQVPEFACTRNPEKRLGLHELTLRKR